MKRAFTVFDLLSLDLSEPANLKLRCLAGRSGLENIIKEPGINHPGLALCGFYDYFGENRLQVFGQGEAAYLNQQHTSQRSTELLKTFFSHKISCAIFTHQLMPSDEFLRLSEETATPVLQSSLGTNDFEARLFNVLNDAFASVHAIHAVFVEVYGLGLLIRGESGVGKSEAALELIERGHKLISDDLVQIRSLGGNYLRGLSAQNLTRRHQMEIRGLGIIDVASLFGMRAVRDSKRIDLVIYLENWQGSKNYDRIGYDEQFCDILGVKIPQLVIPVKPGRNIPIIIEAAVLHERAKLNRLVAQINEDY